MASVLVNSYLSNLRISLQTAEYTRVTEIPSLSELTDYIRLLENGNAHKFVADSNAEFQPGEILLIRNKDHMDLATVYRRTKPRGNIVKHEFVSIIKYWDVFNAYENYTKEHVTLSIAALESQLNSPDKVDTARMVADLWIVYAQAKERAYSTESDGDRILLDRVEKLKDKFYIRLANDIKGDLITPLPAVANIISLDNDQRKSLANCPWFNGNQLYQVLHALAVDGAGYSHPDSVHYSRFLKMIYVKSTDGDLAITENKIFSITDSANLNPRFYEYVK